VLFSSDQLIGIMKTRFR